MSAMVATYCQDIRQMTQAIGVLLQGIREPDPLAAMEAATDLIVQRQQLLETLLTHPDTDREAPEIRALAEEIRGQDFNTVAVLRQRMDEVARERRQLLKGSVVRQAYTLN